MTEDDRYDLEIDEQDIGDYEEFLDEEPAETTDLEPVEAAKNAAAAAEGFDAGGEAFQQEIEHLREMYLRKLAEFDNFRKRTERERAEMIKTAGIEIVQDLIPVLDNFERAIEHASESSHDALEQGVAMISKQLTDTLIRRGMEIFDPVGEPFDPECHEAIQRVEDPDRPPGTVAWVLAKGVRFGGRLLRPAMVGVTFRSADAEATTDGEGEAVS